jgi:hypothetical protein
MSSESKFNLHQQQQQANIFMNDSNNQFESSVWNEQDQAFMSYPTFSTNQQTNHELDDEDGEQAYDDQFEELNVSHSLRSYPDFNDEYQQQFLFQQQQEQDQEHQEEAEAEAEDDIVDFNNLRNQIEYAANDSRFDHEDSINDVLSMENHTPFNNDTISFNALERDINEEEELERNLENLEQIQQLNAFKHLNKSNNNEKNENPNRYSIINYEILPTDESSFTNSINIINSNKRNKTLNINHNNIPNNLNESDLNYANIDEILLIADNSGVSRLDDESINRIKMSTDLFASSIFEKPNFDTPNNNNRTPRMASNKKMTSNNDRLDQTHETKQFNFDQNQNHDSTAQPNNDHGAFKLYYTTDNIQKSDEIKQQSSSGEQNEIKKSSTLLSLTDSKSTNRISPFISIDKPKEHGSSSSNLTSKWTVSSNIKLNNVNSNGADINNQKSKNSTSNTNNSNNKTPKSVTNRSPVKKYQGGSTSSLHINANKKTKETVKPIEKEKSRPSTQHEITYTLDSDESTMIDGLINDPNKLKAKLKQSKMEREQLLQLQQNYLRLLEQYAEAENFIDKFRLATNANENPSPNIFQVNNILFFYSPSCLLTQQMQ